MKEIEQRNKYVIIARSDGDGVCAAAIAVSKLSDPIDIYFSQPYTINGLVNKLNCTEDVSKIRLYILDININDKTILLMRQFKKVVLIDHHHDSIELIGKYPGKIDPYKSTSQLAAEYFSALKSPLATLGTICDNMITLPASDPMLIEAMLLKKSIASKIEDDIFRKELVEQLADGAFPSEITGILARSKDTDNKIKILLNHANTNLVEMDNPIKYAVTYINQNCKGFGKQLAHRLISDRDYPVFLLYPDQKRDKIIIIARNNTQSNKPIINLSDFMSKYFNGGGHTRAAGGAIDGICNCGIHMIVDRINDYCEM